VPCPVRSRNSNVRQLRLTWTVGVTNEPQSRSTAMERNPGFRERPGTMSASPLGGRDANGLLHAPHEEARHSGRRKMPKKVRPPPGTIPSSGLCRVKTDRTVKLAELAASPRCLALPRLGIVFCRYRLALPWLLGGLGHATATAVGQLCVAPVPQILALAPPLPLSTAVWTAKSSKRLPGEKCQKLCRVFDCPNPELTRLTKVYSA